MVNTMLLSSASVIQGAQPSARVFKPPQTQSNCKSVPSETSGRKREFEQDFCDISGGASEPKRRRLLPRSEDRSTQTLALSIHHTPVASLSVPMSPGAHRRLVTTSTQTDFGRRMSSVIDNIHNDGDTSWRRSCNSTSYSGDLITAVRMNDNEVEPEVVTSRQEIWVHQVSYGFRTVSTNTLHVGLRTFPNRVRRYRYFREFERLENKICASTQTP